MSTFFTLFRKEFRSYLISPFGWTVLFFVLLMQGWGLTATLKLFNDGPQPESLLYFTFRAPNFWFYFLFIFPLITMRLFAEEEKTGTMETLMTIPVRTTQVVMAKYFAAFSFYLLLWIPVALYPQIFDIAGQYVQLTQDYEPPNALTYHRADWVGTFGILILMGMFFTAIGCLASSITSSQIISGIVATLLLVLHFFIGLAPLIWGEFPAAAAFHYVSSTEHLADFTRGIIDSRIVVYYLSMTFFTLMLTRLIVDLRRSNS